MRVNGTRRRRAEDLERRRRPPSRSTLAFEQAIGANEALRTGTYATTLTFTLSTATRSQRTRSRPASRGAGLEPLEPEGLDWAQSAVSGDPLLRRPRHEAARELVPVDAGEMDLRQLPPGAVVGLGGDPGARVRRRPRLGTAHEPERLLARDPHRRARPRHLHHELAEERARLQRARERAEPAQVDVDLAQPR